MNLNNEQRTQGRITRIMQMIEWMKVHTEFSYEDMALAFKVSKGQVAHDLRILREAGCQIKGVKSIGNKYILSPVLTREEIRKYIRQMDTAPRQRRNNETKPRVGLEFLIREVLNFALQDLTSKEYRKDAEEFINGDWCLDLCEYIGWDRNKLKRGIDICSINAKTS